MQGRMLCRKLWSMLAVNLHKLQMSSAHKKFCTAETALKSSSVCIHYRPRLCLKVTSTRSTATRAWSQTMVVATLSSQIKRKRSSFRESCTVIRTWLKRSSAHQRKCKKLRNDWRRHRNNEENLLKERNGAKFKAVRQAKVSILAPVGSPRILATGALTSTRENGEASYNWTIRSSLRLSRSLSPQARRIGKLALAIPKKCWLRQKSGLMCSKIWKRPNFNHRITCHGSHK